MTPDYEQLEQNVSQSVTAWNDSLSHEVDAVELLAERLGRGSVDLEPDEADLISRCLLLLLTIQMRDELRAKLNAESGLNQERPLIERLAAILAENDLPVSLARRERQLAAMVCKHYLTQTV